LAISRNSGILSRIVKGGFVNLPQPFDADAVSLIDCQRVPEEQEIRRMQGLRFLISCEQPQE
jgi:hypothetical protein